MQHAVKRFLVDVALPGLNDSGRFSATWDLSTTPGLPGRESGFAVAACDTHPRMARPGAI